MRMPLDTIYITGQFREVAVPGTGLPDASGVRRHIGVDLRAGIGTKVYAVGSGTVTASYLGGAGNTIEIRIGDKLWRFMHLSRRDVAAGAKVSEGQVIGLSGNSGGVLAHLHVDARRDGTLYNASLENYFDPLALIKQGAEMANAEQVKSLYRAILFREADAGGLATYTGWDANRIVTAMLGSTERKNLEARFNGLQAQVDSQSSAIAGLQVQLTSLSGQIDLLTTQNDELIKAVEIKDGEIGRLRTENATLMSQVGDNSKWEVFKALLRELIGR